ncbi:hypothetical protein [Neobacillus mesonae]|uniref:hypothetical protein n=1 Tax=Neobacillus mesonae TaxID=1193713 RepID=UPI00203D184A|nr:hypothetical protein [Neobacillus mesonae]
MPSRMKKKCSWLMAMCWIARKAPKGGFSVHGGKLDCPKNFKRRIRGQCRQAGLPEELKKKCSRSMQTSWIARRTKKEVFAVNADKLDCPKNSKKKIRGPWR